MGDRKALAKARMELEELYLGIPDDSVNLTFEDLAKLQNVSEKKKLANSMEPIQEQKISEQNSATIHKLPSLDFSRGLEATNIQYDHHQHDHYSNDHVHASGMHRGGHGFNTHTVDRDVELETMHSSYNHHHRHHHLYNQFYHNHQKQDMGANHMLDRHEGYRHGVERSVAYEDVSVMNMNSTYQDKGGRTRRPGIPHSNICTICSTFIYIFRHRCLVCGRVYCRNCVNIGMGEMTEGRKCIECLGKRFSARYIQRAGKIGCCSRYPSIVKQAELKWAEKGPRRTGERACGQSTMMTPRSRSPVTPRSPSTPPTRTHAPSSPPSFVANPTYSPHSHHHLSLPL